MPQMLQLLRATCNYCYHLRLSPIEINKFVCKLRLLDHDLVEEAVALENIQTKSESQTVGNASAEDGGASSEDEDEDSEALMRRRKEYVRRVIKRSQLVEDEDASLPTKVEAVFETRRAVVKEFLSSMTKTKYCSNCKG